MAIFSSLCIVAQLLSRDGLKYRIFSESWLFCFCGNFVELVEISVHGNQRMLWKAFLIMILFPLFGLFTNSPWVVNLNVNLIDAQIFFMCYWFTFESSVGLGSWLGLFSNREWVFSLELHRLTLIHLAYRAPNWEKNLMKS